uniref:hypothetical protein n=1 Tax=Candidatus Enterovibrio escicola TaxID=1927127 RepID=UPI001CC26A96|nr:hypothetical protein [Candidatus Enterovibrio escacola]
MNNLDAVFVNVDDFCQTFLPAWGKDLISSGIKQRNKLSLLSVSDSDHFPSIGVSRLKNLLHPPCVSLPHQRIS